MDKYEFNIKVEQIKKMTGEGDYATAMKIADGIDWSRVRNANLLSMIAGVYEKNGEYQEAKDILLLAFERAPVGKRLLYKLAELSVKSGDIEEAEDFYREFTDLAPDDSRACLLEYLILKAKNAPVTQLIHSLEQFTAQELDEKWLYELAELYARAGMGAECVRTCDKITLMFGLGKYSEKALRLKQNFTGLSDYQMDLVENREKYEGNLRRVEEQSARSEELYNSRYQDGRGAEAAPGYAAEDPDVLANTRYANEDEAFEAYLRAHNMDGAESAPKELPADPHLSQHQAEAAQSAETTVSYDDTYVNEGFTDDLSKEVEKLEAEAAAKEQQDGDAQETEAAFDKTQVLDDAIKEKLRKVVIKTGQAGEAARAVNVDVNLAKAGAAAQAAKIAGTVGARAASVAATAAGAAGETVKTAVSGEAPVKEAEPVRRPEPPRPQARVGFTHTEEKQREAEADKNAKGSTAEKPADGVTAAQKTQGAGGNRSGMDKNAAIVAEHGPFHMIIEAESAAEGLEIAIDELKYIHNEYGITNAAAKTSAEKLNERGLSGAALAKLSGKDFIVEHAGGLSEEIAKQICTLIRTDQSGMIVVLVDTPDGLDSLEDKCPELFDLCDLVSDEYEEDAADEEEEARTGNIQAQKVRIGGQKENPAEETYDDEPYVDDADEAYDDDADDVRGAERPAVKAVSVQGTKKEKGAPGAGQTIMPDIAEGEEMEIDDFAQYCCQYAASIDCSVTGKSMLALYERIELMEEDNIPLTRENAEDLIEEAADRAEKPPIGKRLKGMFNSKYDKNGLLILREEDFIH
ncbi:MAG: tetratricopeptide repeat protein [Eubacteriales bacterium]|nr:tetratricopeptide repeat protein [Eubacteriales bacterium]